MKPYEVFDFVDVGYHKLFHHQSWRIAILNYIDELEIDQINYVEAHSETDKVFVLLTGSCTLVFAHVNDQNIDKFECVQLEVNKVYKVPQGTYHTSVLSKDAKVLIVEEENTDNHNSPRIYLSPEDRQRLIACYQGGQS
jgi:hypothetical protein